MNNIYGITYKMGAYINSAIKSNEPICLYTAEDDTGDKFVYMANSYIALKLPLNLYPQALQAYTHTDAPAVGETKTISGGLRNGAGMVDVVETALKAKKRAIDTGFTALALNKKQGTVKIFAGEDGTPLLINSRFTSLFYLDDCMTYCETSISPLVIHMPFDGWAIVLPVRIDAERSQTFRTICESAADRYSEKLKRNA